MKFTPEESLQVQCLQYLVWKLPHVKVWHTPNENKLLSKLNTAGRFFLQKKMYMLGVRAGITDLILPWYSQKYKYPSILFLELKWGKNKLTKDQEEFIEDMRNMGFHADWTNTFDGFLEMLKLYEVGK